MNSSDYVGFNDEVLELKFLKKDVFLICSNSDTLRMVNTKTRDSRLIFGHRDIVTCCDVNPNNHLITGGKDGRIFLWKLSSNGEDSFPEIIISKKYKGHVSYVISVAIGQKTGNVFVSCGGDGLLKLWNIAKQTCKTVKPHQKEINFCRINSNEKYVLTGSQDKQIILYSAKTLKIVRQIKGHGKGVWDGDFAPFELMFATCSSDQLVKVWDLKMILDLHKKNTRGVSNPESNGDRAPAKKAISAEKKPKRELTEDEENRLLVSQVLSNHAGDSIADIIGKGSSSTALDIEKSECLFTLEGHESPAIRVKWVNMGLQLISGDSEGVVKLWNYRKATCLFSVHQHAGRIWSLDIFEDFKFEEGEQTSLLKTQRTEDIRILSGDNDCGLFLWSDDTHRVQAQNLQERQERKVLHSQLEMHMREQRFREAVTLCFERKMNSWFFKSLQRWQKEFLADWFVESIVFSFDDYCRQLYLNLLKASQLTERERRFQQELQTLVEDLFRSDPAHLLKTCQGFITHSKYSWTVQLVLHCLFGSCVQMGNLARLYDELKAQKVDLKRVLKVYLNFSEKLLRRNELQIQTVAKLRFDLKKSELN